MAEVKFCENCLSKHTEDICPNCKGKKPIKKVEGKGK